MAGPEKREPSLKDDEYLVTLPSGEVRVLLADEGIADIGGSAIPYTILQAPDGTGSMVIAVGRRVLRISTEPAAADAVADEVRFLMNGVRVSATVRDRRALLASAASASGADGAGDALLRAPMPGLIVKVLVKKGESVAKGQSLMILEAMKMENDLRSPSDGTVGEVHVTEGRSVEKGDKLLKITGAVQ